MFVLRLNFAIAISKHNIGTYFGLIKKVMFFLCKKIHYVFNTLLNQ